MKISQYFSLLKCNFPLLWSALFLAVVYGLMNAKLGHGDQMFSLNLYGPEFFLLIVPMMSILALFFGGNSGMPNARSRGANDLEFYFTRPISRASVFVAKASLYLFLSVGPLLGVWAYSHAKPAIHLELPYATQHREDTRQFYLTHFKGAYVEEEGGKDKIGSKAFVVLPNGQIERAAFTLIWVAAFTLLMQVAIFVFFPIKPWVVYVVYFAAILLSLKGIGSMQTPSNYEMGLAWVAQHTLLAFLILGISTALAQFYCCRRFVQTEITT